MKKPVPYAIISTVLIQLAAIVIWATQLDARVVAVEQRALSDQGLNEKFARLEERLDAVRQDTGRISKQLEQLAQRAFKP